MLFSSKSSLSSRVVWITGGGSGIGRATAIEFARLGAKVAVSGRRKDRLDAVVAEVNELGSQGLAVPCDVQDEAQIAAAVETVLDTFGRLDIVLANAGYSVNGPIEDVDAATLRRLLDVNVVGAAMTAKHALPALRATGGRIGIVGSVLSQLAIGESGPYCVSKFAVRALGLSLAQEVHGTGVSCTLIHPGFVESEIGQVDNSGTFQADWKDPRPAQLMWTAPRAARSIIGALERRKREHVFTAHGVFGAFLGLHFSGLVHWLMTRFVPKKA